MNMHDYVNLHMYTYTVQTREVQKLHGNGIKVFYVRVTFFEILAYISVAKILEWRLAQ